MPDTHSNRNRAARWVGLWSLATLAFFVASMIGEPLARTLGYFVVVGNLVLAAAGFALAFQVARGKSARETLWYVGIVQAIYWSVALLAVGIGLEKGIPLRTWIVLACCGVQLVCGIGALRALMRLVRSPYPAPVGDPDGRTGD